MNEETWMNRSTSYLATASAILWVPSTCTSAKEKFLEAWESQRLGPGPEAVGKGYLVG